MSVPQTRQELVEKPSKAGVTAPARGDEMEADIQRKLKLWGVIEAFRDGRMPDNEQIDKALEYAINHSPVDVEKLSPDGRVLIDDIRDILETMRMMVQEKNEDELFQQSIWKSYHSDVSSLGPNQSDVIPVSGDQVKADASKAAEHLRVLITLFITNGEARKILNDLGYIGRDLFATAAATAADKARPSQEKLDQVDKEAPSKQWHGADGKIHGTDETPELQIKGPNGAEVRYHPRQDPSEAKIRDNQGNTVTAGEAYDKYQSVKEDAKQSAINKATDGSGDASTGAQNLKATASSAIDSRSGEAQSHAQDIASARDPNASWSQQKDQVVGAFKDKIPDDAKDQAKGKLQSLKEKIPEEHRAKAADALDTTKGMIDDAFPQERRDQFIYRLKKVVVECQEHKDYQSAMSWLLDTLDTYQGHAKNATSAVTESAQDASNDPHLAGAVSGFIILLERFANGRSTNPIRDALDQLYADAQNDEELRQWWHKVDDYVHRALLEPGFILDDSCDEEAREIRESGKYFFQEKYSAHWDRLWDEVKAWFSALAEDPLNQRFGDDWKRLVKDLLFDAEGNMTFKPKLWSDIRHVVIPQLIKQIGYVPIPRAEYTDDKIDLVVENLVLSGPNLFPNVVVLENHNYFKFSPYDTINKTLDNNHHRFRVGLSQIQADIRDVAFSFRKRTGFPKISDHGLADVVISGQGISVNVEVETVENRRDSVFKINTVDVTIDNLKWNIRDAKHELLYKFIRAAATSTIKKAIQAAVESSIRSALDYLDDQLVAVRNNMEEAKKSDETTRRQALMDMYKRKKEELADKKSNAEKRNSTFRIVTDRDSQLNPDMTHDSTKSIAKRLYKVEDAAHSGTEWRSPAFDLVDPAHPATTGRHHPDAKAGAAAGKTITSKLSTSD